ncbi:MAG: holo-ACP synthase [Melioribacteraceae bacterium]
MINGIGVDIIEIDRIQKSVDKFGDKFLNKIYTENELKYSLSKKNKYQHLAARFAAKEAIFKALSPSLGSNNITWQEIEVTNMPNGMPKVKLLGRFEKFIEQDKTLHVTISHSENYVVCFAVYNNNK